MKTVSLQQAITACKTFSNLRILLDFWGFSPNLVDPELQSQFTPHFFYRLPNGAAVFVVLNEQRAALFWDYCQRADAPAFFPQIAHVHEGDDFACTLLYGMDAVPEADVGAINAHLMAFEGALAKLQEAPTLPFILRKKCASFWQSVHDELSRRNWPTISLSAHKCFVQSGQVVCLLPFGAV